MTEEDIAGSGTQYKSASLNIIISRDKTAEDEKLRNIMQLNLTKNRQTGWTGVPCQLYYDMQTHKLHDATLWFEEYKKEILEKGLDGNNQQKNDQPVNRFV